MLSRMYKYNVEQYNPNAHQQWIYVIHMNCDSFITHTSQFSSDSCPKSIGDLFRYLHFGKCPNRSGDLLGAFPGVSPANSKQGYPLSLLPSVSLQLSDMFCWFLRRTAVLLNLIKNWRHNRKIEELSAVLLLFFIFPTIPLLPKLKLVRQSI